MANGIIQVDYPLLERIATQLGNENKRIKTLLQNLHQYNDKLRRGGWIAEAADVFYQDMDNRVLPSVSRLLYALEQSEIVMREIAHLMRRAEDDACLGLRGGNGSQLAGLGLHGLEAGIRGGVDYTQSEWAALPEGSDGRWYGDIGQAQAIIVNGIQTDPGGLHNLMAGASKELGDIPVLGVYNATGGKNFFGFVQDTGQAIADKFQAWSGIRLGAENPAVASLMEAVQQTGGAIPIVAHSQGGAITAAALWELYDQGYDLSNLKVITMGSAEFFFPPGPQYEHRVHLNDVVPMIAGGKAAYYFYDPVTLAKHLLTGEVKVYPSETPLNLLDFDEHSTEGYFQDF